jgi:hypothetical protein
MVWINNKVVALSSRNFQTGLGKPEKKLLKVMHSKSQANKS